MREGIKSFIIKCFKAFIKFTIKIFKKINYKTLVSFPYFNFLYPISILFKKDSYLSKYIINSKLSIFYKKIKNNFIIDKNN